MILAIAATHMLNVIALAAVQWLSPVKAKYVVDCCARLVPPVRDVALARRLADSLDGHGTCLSRSLALAALVPSAEVVIGVNPGSPPSEFAHAWVELEHKPLRSDDVRGAKVGALPASISHQRR